MLFNCRFKVKYIYFLFNIFSTIDILYVIYIFFNFVFLFIWSTFCLKISILLLFMHCYLLKIFVAFVLLAGCLMASIIVTTCPAIDQLFCSQNMLSLWKLTSNNKPTLINHCSELWQLAPVSSSVYVSVHVSSMSVFPWFPSKVLISH